MRVLLVEDDPMIANALRQALKDAVYVVDWVQDGNAAKRALHDERCLYEMVLLDLGLPGCDGMEVLRHLRQTGMQLGVIIITARDAIGDRVEGLDLGADDYLYKPFEVVELLARLRAVTRRLGGHAMPMLSNGVLSLNPATHEASRNGSSHLLSTREFALLHTLLLRPGVIHSRAGLEQSIYSQNEEVESNAIDFLIHAVRKKLGADVIKNVRGAGWMVLGSK